jgi:hypothetical protein
MKKWNELNNKQKVIAIDKNVKDYNASSKEKLLAAFVELVTTGPYYFDCKGNLYVGPTDVTVCPTRHAASY